VTLRVSRAVTVGYIKRCRAWEIDVAWCSSAFNPASQAMPSEFFNAVGGDRCVSKFEQSEFRHSAQASQTGISNCRATQIEFPRDSAICLK